MRVSLGVIAIPSGETPIYSGFISSCINANSADIISISAYIIPLSEYRKAVPAFFFYVAVCCIYVHFLAAGLHKKCKRHIPPINKKGRSPSLMGAPSAHIMPAMQITRGLACHFSRFPPLIDNLSIELFFVRFCALCAVFCGLWSMPHAVGV